MESGAGDDLHQVNTKTGEIETDGRSTVSSDISVGGMITRLISLKGTLALMSLVSVVASVGISTSLGSAVCTEALDDTRETGDNATGVCFDLTKRVLQRKSEDLLVLSSNAVVLLTEVFFAGFYTELRRIRKEIFVTHENTDKTQWPWWESLRGTLMTSLEASEPTGVATIGVLTFKQFYVFLNVEGYGFGAIANPGTPKYENVSMLGLVDTTGAFTLRFKDFPLVARDQDDLKNYDLLPLDSYVWTNIQLESTYVGVNLLYRNYDKFGTPMLLRVSASLPKISRFLKKVSNDTLVSTGAEVYLYLVVGSTWIFEEVAKNGGPRDSQTGFLAGVSHGVAAVRTSDGIDPTSGSSVLLKDTNASDPVISGIAKSIYDRHEAAGKTSESPYFSGAINEEVTVNKTNNITTEEYIIAMTNLKLDGIDWWLVSALSKDFILGDVIKRAVQTQRLLDSQQQQVEDDADEKTRSVIYINTAVALILSLGVVVAVHFIWRSTHHLNSAMQQVADMNLDDVSFSSENISLFHEVRQMQVAFQKMVKNLKEYKAYVPTAVLQGSATQNVVDPPVGDVAVVFTDIVSSTKLWALSSSGMNTALEIHNDVMRKCLHRHNGYEVKTIGDAFMIAFSSHKDALQFCFRVQKMLLKQKWPDELELYPQYSDRDAKRLLWNGIRVRMGCNSGEVITEENPLTGRVDYRGTTINMASRLEAKALPGTVCISESLRQKLGNDLSCVGSPAIAEHGTHELKGLGGGHVLHIVSPAILKDRLASQASTPRTAYELGNPKSIRSGPSAYSVSSAVKLNVQDIGKRTGLSIVSGQVTVAICKLIDLNSRKIFEHCNLLVRVATEAATQTDGVIGTVTGMTITVTWNASQSCKMHVAAALSFASQIQRRAECISRMGVATGTMLHGNIGTHKQRFSTAFGRPLEAAEASANQAKLLGTFCVFSDLTNDLSAAKTAAIAPFLRIVDIWFDTDSHCRIILYEALTTRLMTQLEEAWDSALAGGNKYVIDVF